MGWNEYVTAVPWDGVSTPLRNQDATPIIFRMSHKVNLKIQIKPGDLIE